MGFRLGVLSLGERSLLLPNWKVAYFLELIIERGWVAANLELCIDVDLKAMVIV